MDLQTVLIYWLDGKNQQNLANKAEQYLIQLSQVISPSHINIFQSFSPRFSRIPSFLTLPREYFRLKDNKAFYFFHKTNKRWMKEDLIGWGFSKASFIFVSNCLCYQSKDSIRVRFPGSKNRQIKPSMIRYHYFPLENIYRKIKRHSLRNRNQFIVRIYCTLLSQRDQV